MEYKFLGKSGLQISRLSFGTMTFGGEGTFKHIGDASLVEAQNMVQICIDSGINLFDTADMYSNGKSEELLGKALGAKRDKVLIATKVFFRSGPEIHDVGLSRSHIIKSCENSLKRLNTDYIDLYQLHNFDSLTPLEETISTLDLLIKQGKVRYIGCSNFAGWQVLKALWISDRLGYYPLISQQVYYSMLSRDLENELIPASLDQNLGILVWSPLAFGLLSGKYRRHRPSPSGSRLAHMDAPGTVDWERLYKIADVMEEIGNSRGKTIPQVALNWILCRPGITSLIIGARNEEQLKDNLGAVDWKLTEDEVKRLEAVSELPENYPYWHQHKWGSERNPLTQRTYCPN